MATTREHRRCLVLVVSNLEYGGTQRQVVELARHLDEGRFDAHVCTLSPHAPLGALLTRPGHLHVVSKRFMFDGSVVYRLAGLLRRLRADLVHGFLFDADIAARLAGRLAGTPVVIGSERNADYRLKRRQRLAYRLTGRAADLVIANSSAGAAFHQRVVGDRPERYRVVHNGVDVERFCPGDGRAMRAQLGIDADEKVVGMFASFKRQKNHPLLLAAARRVLERRPRTRFVFAGDELYGGAHGSDAFKREIARLVERLRLKERCLFLGNHDDVTGLYRACDLTVLPSLHEGTPNVLLESMACGVPVVATDVSDNARIVPHGRVGFVVGLGDESRLVDYIGELLANDGRRHAMGLAARQWVVEEFSTDAMAQRMAAVYEELWEQKRGRSGRNRPTGSAGISAIT